MKRFRDSMERKLRRDRPQPSDDLVQRITEDISGRPARRRLNLGLAFALTAALTVAFALTGGIGYAASAASKGTNAITGLVSAENSAKVKGQQSKGASAKQYGQKVLICHIPPGNPDNAHTISVAQAAVPAHLAHGDTLGPCP
jgi:hypothetical protein